MFTLSEEIRHGLYPQDLPIRRKGDFMAIVTSVLYGNEKPTKEQIEEVRQAAKKPIVYDEDCPPLTKEQLKEFARIAKEQRKLRKKQVVAIRLSPETAEKVKALGKGYSSVLSRIIDEAFRNPELLHKCL